MGAVTHVGYSGHARKGNAPIFCNRRLGTIKSVLTKDNWRFIDGTRINIIINTCPSGVEGINETVETLVRYCRPGNGEKPTIVVSDLDVGIARPEKNADTYILGGSGRFRL